VQTRGGSQGHRKCTNNRPRTAARRPVASRAQSEERLGIRVPSYWQTGPASWVNVPLLENQPLTPTDGAP
jgi:hypothetical protein